MQLTIRIEDNRSFSKTIHLDGTLDNQTVADFDKQLDAVLESPLKALREEGE